MTLFSYNIKKMIKEQTNCFHGLYSKCGYPVKGTAERTVSPDFSTAGPDGSVLIAAGFDIRLQHVLFQDENLLSTLLPDLTGTQWIKLKIRNDPVKRFP